jgi:hypothetical protein
VARVDLPRLPSCQGQPVALLTSFMLPRCRGQPVAFVVCLLCAGLRASFLLPLLVASWVWLTSSLSPALGVGAAVAFPVAPVRPVLATRLWW